MPITTDFLITALGALVVILAALVVHLEIKVARFLRGKDGKSLEDAVLKLGRDVEALTRTQQETTAYLMTAEERLRKSVRGVATIRFNPFKGTGTGGNQSFATAFLNEKGDGVVISTLHARERVGIFAKPIAKRKSEYELTEEEKEAIKIAASNMREEKE